MRRSLDADFRSAGPVELSIAQVELENIRRDRDLIVRHVEAPALKPAVRKTAVASDE